MAPLLRTPTLSGTGMTLAQDKAFHAAVEQTRAEHMSDMHGGQRTAAFFFTDKEIVSSDHIRNDTQLFVWMILGFAVVMGTLLALLCLHATLTSRLAVMEKVVDDLTEDTDSTESHYDPEDQKILIVKKDPSLPFRHVKSDTHLMDAPKRAILQQSVLQHIKPGDSWKEWNMDQVVKVYGRSMQPWTMRKRVPTKTE